MSTSGGLIYTVNVCEQTASNPLGGPFLRVSEKRDLSLIIGNFAAQTRDLPLLRTLYLHSVCSFLSGSPLLSAQNLIYVGFSANFSGLRN